MPHPAAYAGARTSCSARGSESAAAPVCGASGGPGFSPTRPSPNLRASAEVNRCADQSATSVRFSSPARQASWACGRARTALTSSRPVKSTSIRSASFRAARAAKIAG